MKVFTQAAGMCFVVLLTGCAGRRVASDFATMEQRLAPGVTTYVTTMDGGRFRGRVASVSAASFRLSLPDGAPRDFLPADVSAIRVKDPLWNGLLIGGGVSALMAGMLNDAGCIEPYASPGCKKVSRAAGIAVTAGVGAVIGAGIDALHHRRVYHGARPARTSRLLLAPALTRTSVSLRMSIVR